MQTKKITKTIEQVVNLGNYQSVRFTSGVEQEVHFTDVTDLALQEEQIWNGLNEDLHKAMIGYYQSTGKYAENFAHLAETCRQKATEEAIESYKVAFQATT